MLKHEITVEINTLAKDKDKRPLYKYLIIKLMGKDISFGDFKSAVVGKEIIVSYNEIVLMGIDLTKAVEGEEFTEEERRKLQKKLFYFAGKTGDHETAYGYYAKCLVQDKDLTKAKRYFNLVLKDERATSSSRSTVHYWLGKIAFDEGQYDQATDYLQKVSKKSYCHKEAQDCLHQSYLKKALQLYEKHQYRDAVTWLTKIPRDSKIFDNANLEIIRTYRKQIAVFFESCPGKEGDDVDTTIAQIVNMTLDNNSVTTSVVGSNDVVNEDEFFADKSIKPRLTEGWFRLIEDGIHVFDADIKRNTLTSYHEMCEAEQKAAEQRNELGKRLKIKPTLTPQRIKALAERVEESERLLESTQPRAKEMIRKLEVEGRFFNPARTRNHQVLELAQSLVQNRRAISNDNVIPMKAENIPSGRAVITAEWATQRLTNFLEASAYCFSGWLKGEKGSSKYACHEKMVFTERSYAEYGQNVSPYPNRLGNCFFFNAGTYADIFRQLSQITQGKQDRERQLAKLMIAFTKTLAPVTPSILRDVFEVNKNEAEEQANSLNIVLYLILIKETTQWLSATEEDCQLAFTVSMARALILLREGYLRLEELFSPNAQYGIFVLTGLYSMMKKHVRPRINAIDRMYNEYIIDASEEARRRRIRCSRHPAQFFFVASRQQMRRDLQEVYGGDSDTDGEGYDSDVDTCSLVS